MSPNSTEHISDRRWHIKYYRRRVFDLTSQNRREVRRVLPRFYAFLRPTSDLQVLETLSKVF